MRRTLVLSMVAAIAATFGLDRTAQAQPPAPRTAPAPAFSPYLNLLRRENPTYLNYYGLVRPQQAAQQAIFGLRQDVANNQAAIQTTADAMTLPTTGHQTFFMNTSRYFMTMGGARGAGGTGGAVGAGMARPTPPVLGGAAAGGGTPRPAAGARR